MALAGVLIAAVPRLVSLGCRPPARSADTRAALLAEAVDGQWRQAAIERRLVTPAPIPLRWSLSDLAVTGSVADAVGAPESPPAFPPLPQQTRITEADLHAGGGRTELHHVYAGLASGRVVVVGAPGAGKSGTAILLLLDALAHRDRLDDTERTRVPVPVLLTVHGWDPNTCSVRDWLGDQLTASYPLFAHRGGRAEAAALVAARDKVALILDGLDEMDAALRPAALQALSDAPFRVVVLARSREMVQAASETWLTGAIAVHLHDVTAPDAADYLQRARTGPPPAGWTDLLTRLREHPDSVLARGLSTPLPLTLLRDTYQAAGDDIRELLDPIRYRTTDALEQHLIARVLPAAYAPRPGRPPPRYTEQQARQTLSFIARKMGKNRDLAWWHIPRWAPATPRVLATGLVFGLVFGVRKDEPQRVRLANWRTAISRQALRQALVFGLMFGLMFGLGLADALIERGTAPGLPMGPRQAWRNDRLSAFVNGLVGGLGLVFGLVGSTIWPTTLAWFQLQLTRQVAAVRLLPFLEDARERDILRTVGAVYQFRPAILQDHLADQATANSLTSSAVPRPS